MIRSLRFAVLMLACALAVLLQSEAQEPAPSPANPPAQIDLPVLTNPPAVLSAPVAPPPKNEFAQLEGMVLNDSTGQPLRRARVTLNPLQAGIDATGSEADDEGHFLLRNIAPGSYSITAARDGFLTSAQPLTNGLRMPPQVTLEAGQNISDVTFRLRPWGVLAGRVRYADGEFGVGVRVQLYRTDHIRGRSAYSLSATTVADDRGQYRFYGLAPGAYLVAASYEPPVASNYREQPTVDAQGRELPSMGYLTTFYPNTELMSQAVPVRVTYGQELAGIDLYMRLARKLTLRGRVLDGSTGRQISGANIVLERSDASGYGAIATNAQVNFNAKGDFEILNVSPGSYRVLIHAAGDAGAVLSGHSQIVVGSEDVDGLELVASPAAAWTGHIVTEGGPFPSDAAPRVTLEPRSMDAQVCNATASRDNGSRDLEFSCRVEHDETYDVFADNLPGDSYLSAVRVGGADVRALGLPGNLAAAAPFDVVLDARGGRVSGAVAGTDNALWGGATLMLIPDPPQRRLQDYRFTYADASGRFLFHGVAPGSYILVAWQDETPCDVYDPGGLDRCRTAGVQVNVNSATEQNVLLTVRTLPQP